MTYGDIFIISLSLACVAISFLALSFPAKKLTKIFLPLWTVLQCAISLRLTMEKSSFLAPLEQSVPLFLGDSLTFLFFATILAVTLPPAIGCYLLFMTMQLVRIAV